MHLFIRLYPILALLTVMLLVEYSLILKRKGRKKWYLSLIIAVFLATTIVFWWSSLGIQHAREWVRFFS